MELKTNTVEALARIIHTNQSNLVQGKFLTGRPARPFSLVPEGYTVQPIEEAALPDFPSGNAMLNDAASFAAYVKRFNTPDTMLFLTAGDVFKAALDYHGVTEAGEPYHGTVAHSASYTLQHSPEWKFWNGIHDKWLSQAAVIELLEEHRADILTPSAADLIRVAEDFKSSAAAEYVTRYNRVTQTTELIAKEQENQRGAHEITPPGDILISLPVFSNGTKVDVVGLFSWAGKPDRFAKVRFLDLSGAIDSARKYERALVEQTTGLNVLLGSL